MSLALQLNTALVTIQEKDQIKLYTDTSNFSDIKRMYSFSKPLKLNETATVIVTLSEEIFINTTEYAAKGALAGALVGGPAFGVVGLLFGGIPGFIGGWKLGTTLTAISSAVEGGIKGCKEFKIKFMSSDKYKTWAMEARKTDVYPVYKKIIEGDQRFDSFICPLSMDLICIPVYAPDGRIYEQSSIAEWIQIKEVQMKQVIESGGTKEQINAKINAIRGTLSPIRAKVQSFTVEDLRYYPEYFIRLDKVAKDKISEMENDETKRVFQEAMMAIKASHLEDKKNIIKMQMSEIMMYVMNNNLNPKISTNACLKLNEEVKNIEKEEKELAKAQV